jgi:hypothetical protein
MPVSNTTHTTEKILRRVKKLRDHMQPEELPLLRVPAIWDDGKEQRSTACDVIVTNQRIFGYYCVTFPRERFFLEDVSLASIKMVSFRHKTFEPMFRELLISDGQRKVYIRAPRRYIEALFAALRTTIEEYVPAARPDFVEITDGEKTPGTLPGMVPIYDRQNVRTAFERSPLAITLLFGGGIVLEILGIGLWAMTQSIQTGLPLFVAGMLAVITATFVNRSRRRR